jgi:exonuclease SbcC
LEHQRKHQSLDAHRTQLKDEEPCPLCGAMEHPYATAEPHFDMNEERLRNTELLLANNGKLVISLQENNKFRVGEMQRIQSEIEQKTQDKLALDAYITDLAKALEWNPKGSLEELQEKRNGLTQRMQHLASCKQAFSANDVFVELQEPQQSWKKALSDYNTAKAERSKRYLGTTIDTDANTLSKKLIESIASQKNLETQAVILLEQLNKVAQQQKAKYEKLQSILLQENIADLHYLRLCILSEEAAKTYRDRKNELDVWRAKLAEKQSANSDSLKTLLEKDTSELAMALLEDRLKLAKEKWVNLSVNLGKISQLLEDDEKTRKKFKNEQTELNNLKKDQLLWKTMNDLIGDSYGNKFSNFVQDLTLEQLIGYANKRLSEFTDRYMLDIPTAAEAEKSDTLKIFDTYMGNARRSVKTLSGGETFLVSLAMAFALSDIASRNVKIESLFIDEGFGTLDPETLDQAITILEKMQNEGDRSVGVISHVGALKERITTQVQLEKSSLGHSQIRVVQ